MIGKCHPYPDLQPPIPPFPVAKKRPDQVSGSHISYVMLDRLEVGMDIAMRHRSAIAAWPLVPHVGSLSASATWLPALTNCSSVRVALRTEPSGRNCRHFSSKGAIVVAFCWILRVAARDGHKANPKRPVSGLIFAWSGCSDTTQHNKTLQFRLPNSNERTAPFLATHARVVPFMPGHFFYPSSL